MKKKNLRSVIIRRFKQTTNSKHHYGLMDNKLSQDFTTTDHNEVWALVFHSDRGFSCMQSVERDRKKSKKQHDNYSFKIVRKIVAGSVIQI